jgi:hypothetical protein
MALRESTIHERILPGALRFHRMNAAVFLSPFPVRCGIPRTSRRQCTHPHRSPVGADGDPKHSGRWERGVILPLGMNEQRMLPEKGSLYVGCSWLFREFRTCSCMHIHFPIVNSSFATTSDKTRACLQQDRIWGPHPRHSYRPWSFPEGRDLLGGNSFGELGVSDLAMGLETSGVPPS